MGSSAKQKKEKKKDFQKAKLKVGKTKAKASNFTDTTFKAKSIVLTQQSLSTSAPSAASQFDHHLGLLNHNNPGQKRDSLAYLTSTILSKGDAATPQPAAVVVRKVKHLVCDGSNAVRTQLIKLFQALPASEVPPQTQELLPWIHAGMTHMVSDIRSTSLDVLAWLLGVAAEQTVSCGGGWVKTLKCFLTILSWTMDGPEQGGQNGWSSAKLSKPAIDSKLLSKALMVLTAFLRAGLTAPNLELKEQMLQADAQMWFPLTHTSLHIMPIRSTPYAYLNLFGSPPDEDGASHEGFEERRDVFIRRFRAPVERGLEWARKEQGEPGRAAKGLERALLEGLVDTTP